jgi:hypothetical protein
MAIAFHIMDPEGVFTKVARTTSVHSRSSEDFLGHQLWDSSILIERLEHCLCLQRRGSSENLTASSCRENSKSYMFYKTCFNIIFWDLYSSELALLQQLC